MDDLTNATNKVGQGLEAAEKEAVSHSDLHQAIQQSIRRAVPAWAFGRGRFCLRDCSCVRFPPAGPCRGREGRQYRRWFREDRCDFPTASPIVRRTDSIVFLGFFLSGCLCRSSVAFTIGNYFKRFSQHFFLFVCLFTEEFIAAHGSAGFCVVSSQASCLCLGLLGPF
jgi:hypothetical protein